jgi:hypothetical protein
LRRAALALGGFVAGFVAVYAIAMGLAIFGFSSFAGLPYERLLGWMCVGGAAGSAIAFLIARH